ncbi:MAG: 50S ribosomal protein L13 [Planctomycetota bacterium]|nr:50S ribosomal protein L13 [Planctomycetota bacterium]
MAAVETVRAPKGFKTWVAKPGEVKQKWYVVDADGQSLGRIASAIAMKLMGKDKPTYTAHIDTGDFVIVVNAGKVATDPAKQEAKIYQRWSGYLGGLKKRTLAQVREAHPERVVERAVRLMLPKGRLGKQMFSKLKVYKGADHPHKAQQPEAWAPLAKR